ncbi:hypothetical protein HOY80DRAFT_1141411 [Tuber brumale]|nr:hypothetical protein HOY80DRAFT_1141411 [Tuber brumale]
MAWDTLCGISKLLPPQLMLVGLSLKLELGHEETAEVAKNYKVRVINVWRPLVDIVADNPLAMCDARTVKASDLVSSVHVSSDYTRRNYIVKYSPDFQFYYLSKMTKEEICSFMVFDSCGVGEERRSKFKLLWVGWLAGPLRAWVALDQGLLHTQLFGTVRSGGQINVQEKVLKCVCSFCLNWHDHGHISKLTPSKGYSISVYSGTI